MVVLHALNIESAVTKASATSSLSSILANIKRTALHSLYAPAHQSAVIDALLADSSMAHDHKFVPANALM